MSKQKTANYKNYNYFQYKDLLARPCDVYAKAKYEVILKWLSNLQVKSVLNAGCGSGEFSFILAKQGFKVSGIDPSKKYIELAKRNANDNGFRNCYFAVSSIEEYKPKKLFDAVVSIDVLEHIESDRHAAERLCSFVKPNGFIVISVPAGQWLYGYHDKKLDHLRRYSVASLKKIFPKNVSVIRVRHFAFSLIPMAFLFSKLLRKPYPVAKTGINPITSKLLTAILKLEQIVSLPLGTSILLIGKVTK